MARATTRVVDWLRQLGIDGPHMRCSALREQHWECVSPRRGLRPGDQVLDAGQEPPLGAHMVTLRQGYMHHGIYVGLGCVVHYGGFSRGFRRGPVEEVPLSRFSLGRPIWIRTDELEWKDRPEVVRRARSRLGEDSYHVLSNNCEHFCEWAVQCRARSYQVDELLGGLRRTRERLAETLARFVLELTRQLPGDGRLLIRRHTLNEPELLP
jgi:hypothetical protein